MTLRPTAKAFMPQFRPAAVAAPAGAGPADLVAAVTADNGSDHNDGKSPSTTSSLAEHTRSGSGSEAGNGAELSDFVPLSLSVNCGPSACLPTERAVPPDAVPPDAACADNQTLDTCTTEQPTQDAAGLPEADCTASGSSSILTSSTKLGPQDFEMLRVVGQGAFGKVFQVQHKGTHQVYAMKVMRKERILQKDHSEYVKAERDLLTAVVHPYIVTLRFSFQTPTKLYLVLDFINGGHLFFNLYREGVFSEDVARLYCAQIVSALSYLHSIGIMHRDLKPENVLLDHEGHVRLTDFGLAKGNMESDSARSNSFIGTMEYMAPEIIEAKGHTKSVDWWSTGILLYEMLCGVPPFRAKSRQALQTQILSSKVKYPKFLSNDALTLLKGLLTRDPAKRLGAGAEGSQAIRRHPFFKSIHWAKLEARQVPSKFVPAVTCSRDINNFDKLWTDQPAEDSPCGTPTAQQQQMFHGFTYVAPSFLNDSAIKGALSGTPAMLPAGPVAYKPSPLGAAGTSPAPFSTAPSGAPGPHTPAAAGPATRVLGFDVSPQVKQAVPGSAA